MSNEEPRRVKVIETYYNEEVDLVKWEIEDIETGKRRTIAYKGEDLGPAMGIVGDLLPEHIKTLCESMKGKEFNHIDKTADMPDISGENSLEGADMQKLHDHIDNFPYFEVMQDSYGDKRKKNDN
jgi:hypothetical protein